MTITPFEMYWITRASALNTMFLILSIVFAFLSIALTPAVGETCQRGHKDTAQFLKQIYKVLLPLLALSILGVVFIPRTKELAAIIAIPAIVNSNIAQERVPEALNGIFNLAEAWMEELKPDREKQERRTK